ncbi:MAG: GGDEF domain-containing protein [Byssovorax sp.]
MPADKNHRESVETVVSTLPAATSPESPGATGSLVVIYGADLGRRIPLGTTTIEFGRSSHADIPLPDDDAVSRHHAKIAWTGQGYAVTDLRSTNGTFVNDHSVVERTLRDGDQIKIGRSIFKLICGSNVEIAYHEEIYRLMTEDGLTQVQNKRAFENALEREVSRAGRYERPLSLLVFDLDHFKKINDTLGHLAGDAVLRQVGGLLKANVRREDVLARVGGEEFALLLPEVGIDAARGVAEKLRSLIHRTPSHFEDHTIALSASFGVAALDRDRPMTATALYQAADERLYLAKNGGRNRVM